MIGYSILIFYDKIIQWKANSYGHQNTTPFSLYVISHNKKFVACNVLDCKVDEGGNDTS